MILNLIFLFSVKIFGEGGNTGNTSWIRFGPIGVQPAAFAKLIFIFTFANHITLVSHKINNPLSLLGLLAHGGITTAFVYLFSKDLGMAITYILIMVIMIFVSGLSMGWIVPLGALGAFAMPFVYNNLAEYQRLRIEVVWNPAASDKYAYHAKQSRLAIGSGGLWGSGFLQGRQTQYAILPAKHTDFIFAVCAEEFGLVGCLVLMFLLTFIILKIFYNGVKMYEPFSFLICVGIGTMFLVQTLINIGMCAGVAPVIGLTLPFVSYGGTSVVTNFCAIGMVAALVVRNRPRRTFMDL